MRGIQGKLLKEICNDSDHLITFVTGAISEPIENS